MLERQACSARFTALCPACRYVSDCLGTPGAAAPWASHLKPGAVAGSGTVSCCYLAPAEQPGLVHLRSLCCVLHPTAPAARRLLFQGLMTCCICLPAAMMLPCCLCR